MNKVIIMGRMTRDIEMRATASGVTVGSFTLAVDGIKKDDTSFINCKAFGNTAEVIEKYAGKGRKLAVEGHIQTGSYEKDGKKVYTFDVIADRIEFCDKASDAKQTSSGSDDFMNVADDAVDELPFV